MSGIEKITAKILNEANESAEAQKEKARQEAAQIKEAAVDKAEQTAKDMLKKAEIEAEEIRKRRLSVADLEGRKLRLAAKQEVAREAFDLALTRFLSMPEDDYVSFLAAQIIGIAQGGEEILLNKKDQKLADKLLKKIEKSGKNTLLGMTVSKEIADINGGFLLKQGAVEINMSFDTVLSSYRETLLSEVVSVLFDE